MRDFQSMEQPIDGSKDAPLFIQLTHFMGKKSSVSHELYGHPNHADNMWHVESSNEFLNEERYLDYWAANPKWYNVQKPLLLLPDGANLRQIKRLLIAYSSYPDAEEMFLRIGMDLALRLQSHLHCLKVVKPPQLLFSKKNYKITDQLECTESIQTHESISEGILNYASQHAIGLIALLTRPWLDPTMEKKFSHSLKIIQKTKVPILLCREDQIEHWPIRKNG